MGERERAILAIDLGTSRIKVGRLTRGGEFRLVWAAPTPTTHTHPGAVEQDPARIVALCLEGLAHAAEANGVVEALVLTGQMGGLVLVDSGGGASSPWVPTMDTRCAADGTELRRGVGERVRRLCASAPQQAERLRWVVRAGPAAWHGHAALALVLAPYVATQLAAEGLAAAYCERTCTGWTGLADVQAQRWDADLVEAALWTVERLPRIVEPGTVVGSLAPAAAARTGLAAGLPLIAGPGDQAASYFGAGCAAPGDVADSASTFPVMGGVAGGFRVPANPRVEVMPAARQGLWHPLVYLLGTGSMPGWFAEAIAATPLAQLEHEAAALGDAAGVFAVPYGSPVGGGWSESVFWGAGPAHRRGHLYRAVLEGIAFEYALLAEELSAEGIAMDAPVISFGGGNASSLLRRLKAAVLGVPFRCLATDEMALAGAALIAGRAVGWSVELRLPAATVVEPDRQLVERYGALLAEYRAVRQALAGAVPQARQADG
jgi:xylulokinase